MIYVLVARPRRCLTLSNPVPWQNWMAAYLGYTLQMKTLFRGWPIMAHETHTRRRRRTMLSAYLWYVVTDICGVVQQRVCQSRVHNIDELMFDIALTRPSLTLQLKTEECSVSIFMHACGQNVDTLSNYCDNIQRHDKRRFSFCQMWHDCYTVSQKNMWPHFRW